MGQGPEQGGTRMEDLGERMAQLLGSEEGMEQVRQLMASLSGEGGPDLGNLLGMLGGAGCGSPQNPSQGSGSGDPGIVLELTRALSAVRRPDPNVALLQALRPFFEQPRQKKVDHAIQMMRLMELPPLLQQSGLLSGLLGGDENG